MSTEPSDPSSRAARKAADDERERATNALLDVERAHEVPALADTIYNELQILAAERALVDPEYGGAINETLYKVKERLVPGGFLRRARVVYDNVVTKCWATGSTHELAILRGDNDWYRIAICAEDGVVYGTFASGSIVNHRSCPLTPELLRTRRYSELRATWHEIERARFMTRAFAQRIVDTASDEDDEAEKGRVQAIRELFKDLD